MSKILRFIFIFLSFITSVSSQNTKNRLDKLYNDVTIGQTGTTDFKQTLSEVESILKESSLSTEDRLKGMLIMANLYKLKGENRQSLEIAEKARQLAFEKKLYLWEARLLGYISSGYRVAEMMDMSQEKLNEAIKVAGKAPESEDLYRFYANAYHELAYYENSKKEFTKAISWIQKSNSYLKKINNTSSDFLLASNYQYTGTLFNRMKQADSAIYYFDNSLKLTHNQFDLNTRTLQNYSYVNLGYSYLLKNDLQAVKKNLQKVLNDSLQFRTIDLNQDLFNNLVSYYERKKNIDSIRIYKTKLDSVNDILYKTSSETINSVTAGLNDEIKSLKKSNNYNYTLIIIITIFSLCIVAVAYLRNVNKNKTEPLAFIDKELKTIELKEESKPEDLNIAKETELRLIEQIKVFEENQHYLDPNVSTTQMANNFNTNTKYITYVLKKMYDQDFKTYINTLRVDYIVDLLKKEPKYREYKISYLAEIAGYSSHSKFTAIFKKIKGCSPSEFINELNK